jgi:peptide-methionine (R)-S-oxide reductase
MSFDDIGLLCSWSVFPARRTPEPRERPGDPSGRPERLGGMSGSDAPMSKLPNETTDEEWRQRLSPEAFSVLREHGTERPGSSSLNNEKRTGVFRCAGCGSSLFPSDTKFESGTGWPSFWAPIERAVETVTDRSHFMTRVEVHCAHCGGHLGHVFPDGPAPTGQRYCMNGVALRFEPSESA